MIVVTKGFDLTRCGGGGVYKPGAEEETHYNRDLEGLSSCGDE